MQRPLIGNEESSQFPEEGGLSCPARHTNTIGCYWPGGNVAVHDSVTPLSLEYIVLTFTTCRVQVDSTLCPHFLSSAFSFLGSLKAD